MGRVLVFVEFRGAAAGVGRASHCASTGGPHWAPRPGDGENGGVRLVTSLETIANLTAASERGVANEDD